VFGCLRYQAQLDWLIAQLAKRPKLDAEVRIALRMGVFQLRYLDRIPRMQRFPKAWSWSSARRKNRPRDSSMESCGQSCERFREIQSSGPIWRPN
jgi:hypothetical protein